MMADASAAEKAPDGTPSSAPNLPQRLLDLELRVRQLHRTNPTQLRYVEASYCPVPRAGSVGVCRSIAAPLPTWLGDGQPVLHSGPQGPGFEAVRGLFSALRDVERAEAPKVESATSEAAAAARAIWRVAERVRAVVREDALLSVSSPLHRRLVEDNYLKQILDDRKRSGGGTTTGGTRLVDRLFEILTSAPLAGLVAQLEDAETATREKQAPNHDQPTHSEDFSTVNWFGRSFSFNPTQARCVELLWTEWKKGDLGLNQSTIREAIDRTNDRFRLDLVFRGHAAWKTMIQRAGPGVYRLVTPQK